MSMLPPEIPQCRHIKQNGVCCGSPALRGHDFCYYHQNRREERRRQFAAKPYALGRAAFDLPTLEDINAVQVALEETIRAVLEDRIELKRAALALWGLQVASANAKRVRMEPHWKDVVTECETETEAEEDTVEIKACAEKEPVAEGASLHPGVLRGRQDKAGVAMRMTSAKVVLVGLLASVVLAQNPPVAQAPRPTPPTRDPNTPGYVAAKELIDGVNPAANADGNFILGPT